MDIKIFGPSSSSLRMVVSVLSRFLKKASIPFNIREVNDVSTLLSEGVESVPAIQLDKRPIVGLQSNGSFYNSLREMVDQILKSENYGEMPKIIIPIDFSDSSINALIFGHRLATDSGAVTKAIHVQNETSDRFDKEDVNIRLERIVNAINKDWGSDVLKASFISSEIREGNPVEKILHSIEDNAGELLIVGTKNDNTKEIKWFGSVAVELMTLAPCPVLQIPENARYKGIRKVLIAMDNHELSPTSIKSLVDFCLPLGAEIHCVHISKRSTKIVPSIPKLKALYDESLLTSSSVFHIDIAKGLQQYSELNDIDLIAIAPSSKTIFKHFMNNSVSKQLVNINSMPTLILK